MTRIVAPIASIGGQPAAAAAPAVESAPVTENAREIANQAADLRLVIEEDPTTGRFIYKTLDRRTGEVVRQLPREDVLRLKDGPTYEPGDVADQRN